MQFTPANKSLGPGTFHSSFLNVPVNAVRYPQRLFRKVFLTHKEHFLWLKMHGQETILLTLKDHYNVFFL